MTKSQKPEEKKDYTTDNNPNRTNKIDLLD
jgi:hypothetical protein